MERLHPFKQMRGIDHEPATVLLEAEHVSVTYTPADGVFSGANGKAQKKYALHDLSFRIEAGERVAVVGPNGAGKSTLFKVVAGTLKPSEGQIHVYGHGPDEHICIAYVPQRSQIDWSFPATVEDVVMMGRVGQIGLFRWPRRRDWQIVQHSLRRVNATHLAKKQIGELSGGQQQRVFIARALAQQAEMLLLDEPFTGLDVPSYEAIFEVLAGLQADGVTVVVATHDLNLAADRFDRVMLLNKEMVAFGPPAQALTSTNLVEAYGGHMHLLDGDDGPMVLADTCCDGHEMAAEKTP